MFTIFRLRNCAMLPAFVVAISSSAIQLFDLNILLRYERNTILSGALWRIFTGQLAHLGWPHLVLNLATLILIMVIYNGTFSALAWWRITLVCMVGTGVGLLVFNPKVTWYVGLSGLLHGWFAAGAIVIFLSGALEGAWLLALLAIKLVWEQWQGSLSSFLIDANGIIIVAAHLHGALSGLGIGLLETQKIFTLNLRNSINRGTINL
ncbi:Rhomboid domain-containing protein [Gammaproteobacteria bacterium]